VVFINKCVIVILWLNVIIEVYMVKKYFHSRECTMGKKFTLHILFIRNLILCLLQGFHYWKWDIRKYLWFGSMDVQEREESGSVWTVINAKIGGKNHVGWWCFPILSLSLLCHSCNNIYIYIYIYTFYFYYIFHHILSYFILCSIYFIFFINKFLVQFTTSIRSGGR